MGVYSNSMRCKNNKLLCKPDIPAKGQVRLNHFHKYEKCFHRIPQARREANGKTKHFDYRYPLGLDPIFLVWRTISSVERKEKPTK